MNRSLRAVTLACVAACGHAAPVEPIRASDATPTPLPTEPMLVPGEQMVWEVYWQGVQIGRADLVVGQRDARTTFSTGLLASALAIVKYDLTTALEPNGKRTGDETIVIDGETEHTVCAIDGVTYVLGNGRRGRTPGESQMHTLHSALGAVRAWASLEARRGFLWLVMDANLYRLDVDPPERDDLDGIAALRIESVVRPLASHRSPAEITIWLAASADHTPLRFVVNAKGERISAQLTETTATLASR